MRHTRQAVLRLPAALSVALILALGACGNQTETEPEAPVTPTEPAAAIETPEQPETPGSPAPPEEPEPESIDYAPLYAETVRTLEKEAAGNGWELCYRLVQLDWDDVPELVADNTGYWISVYGIADGTVYPLIDQWSYGAAGIAGYDFVPGGNVVRGFDNDYAGAVVYESYYMVSDDGEIVSYYDQELKCLHFEDQNHNTIPDEIEPFSDDPTAWFYGGEEITAGEYESYQIPGDYEPLMGEQTAEELLQGLET